VPVGGHEYLNGIVRGGSPCALIPSSPAPEEHLQMWHVLSVHKHIVGERIQGLRVFNLKHSLQRKW